MKTVSMLDFRRDARAVIERVQRGQRVLLTYRGRPMAHIEPITSKATPEDPFYALAGEAVAGGRSLTNQQIDESLYGA